MMGRKISLIREVGLDRRIAFDWMCTEYLILIESMPQITVYSYDELLVQG